MKERPLIINNYLHDDKNYFQRFQYIFDDHIINIIG